MCQTIRRGLVLVLTFFTIALSADPRVQITELAPKCRYLLRHYLTTYERNDKVSHFLHLPVQQQRTFSGFKKRTYFSAALSGSKQPELTLFLDGKPVFQERLGDYTALEAPSLSLTSSQSSDGKSITVLGLQRLETNRVALFTWAVSLAPDRPFQTHTHETELEWADPQNQVESSILETKLSPSGRYLLVNSRSIQEQASEFWLGHLSWQKIYRLDPMIKANSRLLGGYWSAKDDILWLSLNPRYDLASTMPLNELTVQQIDFDDGTILAHRQSLIPGLGPFRALGAYQDPESLRWLVIWTDSEYTLYWRALTPNLDIRHQGEFWIHELGKTVEETLLSTPLHWRVTEIRKVKNDHILAILSAHPSSNRQLQLMVNTDNGRFVMIPGN